MVYAPVIALGKGVEDTGGEEMEAQPLRNNRKVLRKHPKRRGGKNVTNAGTKHKLLALRCLYKVAFFILCYIPIQVRNQQCICRNV